MLSLSVVIITFNEEKRIEKCISAVQSLADEIVVIDSFSTDKTKNICEKYGVRFIQREWTNFGDAKRFAVQQATHNYILSLDADEVVSTKLKNTIQDTKANWVADAYHFNRLTFVGDKPIRHGGWYPDSKIRLFDRRKANWTNVPVHETVVPTTKNCVVRHLQGDLLHYSYENIDELMHSPKHKLYTNMYSQKKKLNKIFLYLKCAFTFVKTYLFRLGFLDGKSGWAVAVSGIKYTYSKYS